MIAAALLAAVAAMAAPSPAACATAIRHGDPDRVPRTCWRVGPLTLGMTQAEVERALGPPSDALSDDTGMVLGRKVTYRDLVYVFPHDLADRLAMHPVADVEFQLLTLTFDGDRLVRISNAPDYSVSGPRCHSVQRDARAVVVDPAAFAPFQVFAGIRVGDRLTHVRQVLGRWSSVNRGGDFYSYSPIPVTLDAFDAKRLNGFAIGADNNVVFQGAAESMVVDRDPATCLVHGFRFTDPSGG